MLVLWLKAFHVIFMVSWFAGIFYLPRLYVYHAMVPPEDTAGHERFVIMERKLYRFITPFMVLTAVFGFWILYEYGMPYLRTSAWMHVKLALVTALVGYHFYLGHLRKKLADRSTNKSHVFFRFLNEAPVLILFAVVILVIVKPF
jgi:putative membrane protein